MQKFLSMLFSRRALAIVGVVMLALLVWFIGLLVALTPCIHSRPWEVG